VCDEISDEAPEKIFVFFVKSQAYVPTNPALLKSKQAAGGLKRSGPGN